VARPQQDDPNDGRQRSRLMQYAGLGFELAASIVGLTLLGLWIDYRYSTGPKGVLIGVGLGVVGGLYNFVRAALRLSRSEFPTQHPRSSNKDRDRDQQ
jgi:F0F1-type ATP synthase assembly protein I